MTAMQLLSYELDMNFGMIHKLVDDLTDADLAFKPTDDSMTLGDHLEHLIECNLAVIASIQGKEHEWGSYAAADASHSGLVKEFDRTRAEARGMIEGDSEDSIKTAASFFGCHDQYHVGQMSLARQILKPGWSSFALYE